MMKKTIPCALLALVASSLCAAAVSAATTAQVEDALPKRVVKYADLDISSTEGAAVLYGRINRAAREVCEPADAQTLDFPIPRHRCADQAVERAVTQVSSPALARYYHAKTGRTISATSDLGAPSRLE
jgi:UrcA family protein